ncbi:hypothetical protein [Mycobacterium phage Weirdo19]|uniref:Helix-turn-helix DNA binding domain protein n=1 Tax=Mycobacterium phage Weirdo19 TaxID=2601610 RepID=A0A6M2YSQ4_9CAUD|nr:hypothetical protein KDJ11_gp35 [Mycobacterium phage Weirdo19]QEA10803.1 hypothetical protein [Mycobacterium phage Weirdo19]
MRITTERTELVVEVFEVPDELRSATDAELLAVAEHRAPVEGRRQVVGDRVVVDRGEDDIELAAAAYREARAAVERAEARAKALVVETAGEGTRSEAELAKLLGVDRMTVRRWRGKL